MGCKAMLGLIWVCLCSIWFENAAANYYHTKSSQEFKPSGSYGPNSKFGFSIAYYPVMKSLMISAPTETPTGAVYMCNINSKECTNTLLDNVSRYGNYTNNYWFGAALGAGKRIVVTCAPRLLRHSSGLVNFGRDHNIGEFGRCYYLSGTDKTWKTLHDISPKDLARYTKYIAENMHSDGWSISIDQEDSILVGGPASFTGRAMYYKSTAAEPFPLYNGNPYQGDFFGTPYKFGYSVASGYFSHRATIYFAVGSPYGTENLGVVYFYKKDSTSHYRISPNILNSLQGNVVGSGFGAVLCAAKLSEKGTDLIVGAPLYSEGSNYDIGAVHIYIYRRKELMSLRRTIKGSNNGGMFGSAIISLGDLNGDGRDEIAIAAPYGDKASVAVYSSADLLSERSSVELERVTPLLAQPYRPIGLSIAALDDYDDNGCKELAIGSPLDNAVMLFSCFASVTVKMSTSYSVKNVSDRHIEVCLHVKYPKKPKEIIAEVSTVVAMTHPHARLSEANTEGIFEFRTPLNDKQEKYCKNVPFIVSPGADASVPIAYNVVTKLTNDPNEADDFDSSRLVLSDLSELQIGRSIDITECDGPEGCVPNLNLTITTSMSEPYTIGTNQVETFEISLINLGDKAVDACVDVEVAGVLVQQRPAACVANECSPKRTLRFNETWDLGTFYLDMSEMTNQVHNVEINVTVFDECGKRAKQPKTLNITLFADPKDINITADNNGKSTINLTKTQIEEEEIKLEHIITITNKGPVQWLELESQFMIDKKPYLVYGDIVGDAITQDTDYNVTFDLNHRKSDIIGSEINLILPISVKPSVYDNLYVNKEITFTTNFTLFIDGKSIKTSVSTTLHLVESGVAWWVFALAGVSGILLGCGISVALIKCGCLRRENKENLQNLQASINRQSLRRSMLLQSHDNADLINILDKIDE